MEWNVMSKQKKNSVTKKPAPAKKRMWIFLCVMAAVVLVAAICLFVHFRGRAAPNVTAYKEKVSLLEASALTKETNAVVGENPAGGQAGYAVFFSVCNTTERASVFCGTGPDLRSAWKAADEQVTSFLADSNYDPVWVKADIVSGSEVYDTEEVNKAIEKPRDYFLRYGIAFDQKYQTALLEAELNGAGIYNYSDDILSLKSLNRYLNKAGREPLDELPNACTLFQCISWFCDETNTVYALSGDGPSYGRRNIPLLDDAYATQMLGHASSFLMEQLNEDGSFVYGLYPRFDRMVDGYNIIRHAGTIWALACQYKLTGDERLLDVIDPAIDYLLTDLTYADDDTAYILKEKNNEIEIGTSGLTIVALTEYMDAVDSDRYLDVCRDLGNGIVALLDQETGTFYQVLNDDFTRKEQFRIVYYDGEATFALCRLYGMTGEQVWLDAAKTAVDHFIEADYTEYKDHWIAYSMNEITKYVDDPEYYTFGLRNVQENLDRIRKSEITSPTYMEMLMATFELYTRIEDRNIKVPYLETNFDLGGFLETVNIRANRMLDGYTFPEFAMYMAKPQKILNTFMVRHDSFRIRIDDVQHNIGGYYLYAKNYEKLVSYGLLNQGDKDNG